MKSRVYFFVLLCGASLFVFSCVRKCDVEIERPSDVMPICWEDYNDAYHVFWNIFKSDCSGIGTLTGKTIKISGKFEKREIHRGEHVTVKYVLKSVHEYEHKAIYDIVSVKYTFLVPLVEISCPNILEEFLEKIDSADLTEKCYIEGKLCIGNATHYKDDRDQCCFTVPYIHLESIDDIYFESNKGVNSMPEMYQILVEH